MPKIIILSEEDCDHILYLLKWRETVTSPRQRRLIELFEKAPTKVVIRIIIEGGALQDVEGLPMGFYYELQDFDNCSECGGLDPDCEWCKEPF